MGSFEEDEKKREEEIHSKKAFQGRDSQLHCH
jgi:hypothetical protein